MVVFPLPKSPLILVTRPSLSVKVSGFWIRFFVGPTVYMKGKVGRSRIEGGWIHSKAEFVFVDLLRNPGIDSQPGGTVR
jgi:hypothetical protein